MFALAVLTKLNKEKQLNNHRYPRKKNRNREKRVHCFFILIFSVYWRIKHSTRFSSLVSTALNNFKLGISKKSKERLFIIQSMITLLIHVLLLLFNREKLLNCEEWAHPGRTILEMHAILRRRDRKHVSIQQTRMDSSPKCQCLLLRLWTREGVSQTLALSESWRSSVETIRWPDGHVCWWWLHSRSWIQFSNCPECYRGVRKWWVDWRPNGCNFHGIHHFWTFELTLFYD